MSNHFEYREGRLFAEDLSIEDLASQYGTPLYIYSVATLARHVRAWQEPLGERGTICYAVKANSNIGVLSLIASMGGGFDIVSGGELHRVLMAGGDPTKVVFSGVGKSAAEMKMALNAGIHCFNVESVSELELLNQVAGDLRTQAPVSLRVNPDVDAKTHPYISTGLSENKFGIDIKIAPEVYALATELPNIRVIGVDFHIGSQLTELAPYWDALDRVLNLVDALEAENIILEHIDLGGGLGVTYRDEIPPHPSELYEGLFERLGNRPQKLVFEPGRSIAANAGVLITRVMVTKENTVKNFAVVDAAMNDMLRPALYQSWMNIQPVVEQPRETKTWDIVGPICESADFLGKERELGLVEGDLLCIFSAGAYGFCMSSNYNSRTRAAEVMVSGDHSQITRERESLDDLIVGEHRFMPEKD